MSSDAIWTWVLFGMEIIGVTGMFLVGKHRWYGWVVVLMHSIPWFAYSIIHNKPGSIVMSALWWVVNMHNAIKWFREGKV